MSEVKSSHRSGDVRGQRACVGNAAVLLIEVPSREPRRRARTIKKDNPILFSDVRQEKAVAAHPGLVLLHDAGHIEGRNGRIDRVAAALQNFHGGYRFERVFRGRHPELAHYDRPPERPVLRAVGGG